MLASPPAQSTGAAPVKTLPFEQRACFVAGPAKSGTTLLVSLLDGHPGLLAFPEETAYFPTVRTKYGGRSRREQFDYLTASRLPTLSSAGLVNGTSAVMAISRRRNCTAASKKPPSPRPMRSATCS